MSIGWKLLFKNARKIAKKKQEKHMYHQKMCICYCVKLVSLL